jgi:hypothetical protein
MESKKEPRYQVRIFLSDAFAKAARETPYAPELAPLAEVLRENNATLSCQFDEFRNFVNACEAHGAGDTRIAAWTRATVEDPAKREKYLKVFIVNVGGDQLFSARKANELFHAFKPLVAPGIVTRISRPDDNPAHNPQPRP